MKEGDIHIVIDDYKSVYNHIKKNIEDYNYISPFQEYSFYKFYKKQDNCDANAFSGFYNDKLLVSVVVIRFYDKGLKRHFTKRAVVYGGPIIHKTSPHVKEVLDSLLIIMCKRLKRKAIYLEFRNLSDYSCFTNNFLTQSFKYKPYVNYCLNIRSLEEAEVRFSSEKRRQIKKAINHGAYICEADSPNQIEQFYAILKNLYVNKVKKPIPRLKFFLNLFFSFRKYNNGTFMLVCYQNKVIGGTVCTYNKSTIYDWYRCGLDQDFKNCYPSALAVYGGITKGIEVGCSMYDFMGAGMLKKHYGVRKFKAQFGGDLVEYGRYLLVLNPVRYAIGKVALNFKKLFV